MKKCEFCFKEFNDDDIYFCPYCKKWQNDRSRKTDCPNCKKRIDADAVRCRFCGDEIKLPKIKAIKNMLKKKNNILVLMFILDFIALFLVILYFIVTKDTVYI